MALQKTISFILLIVIGILLKKKIKHKDQLGGVKVLILSIALPATIFVALLKIKIDSSLLFLPLLALVFNVIMLFAARAMLPYFGFQKAGAESRTMMLLLPSLAPGLSCFPFILEYLGEESLARAALTDVGNKVFVLIILYLLAMQWYYQQRKKRKDVVDADAAVSTSSKLKDLLLSLVREPVNLVIVTALLMLGVGWDMLSLPPFLQDAVGRMSILMTPMVLIFIGMAVRFQRSEMALIFKLLSFRAGLAFVLSALFLAFLPAATPAGILLAIVFPQSACSFWPFAHMSAVSTLESADGIESKEKQAATFHLDLALNTLALSLPFSTIIILSIFSLNDFFLTTWHTALVGLGFLFLATVPGMIAKLSSNAKRKVSTEPNLQVQQLVED